jgi:hypothetical protein
LYYKLVPLIHQTETKPKAMKTINPTDAELEAMTDEQLGWLIACSRGIFSGGSRDYILDTCKYLRDKGLLKTND